MIALRNGSRAVKNNMPSLEEQRVKNENVDIKQLGLVGRTKEKILEELKAMYETL